MQHRGKKVAAVVRSHNITIVQLSEKLGKNRNTLYNWFNDVELPLSKIKLIGKAIDHDFKEEFPYLFEEFGLVNDPQTSYSQENSTRRELNELYKKYSKLLEAYMDLNERFNAKNAQSSD